MFPSIMAPKIPILVSQCEMDHQKPTILLIFSTLSLGGCGGHPMRPKLNLKDKSQMSTPNEYTDNLKSNLICIFLSVRTKSKKPLCPRTQCSQYRCRLVSTYHSYQFRQKSCGQKKKKQKNSATKYKTQQYFYVNNPHPVVASQFRTIF